MAAAGNNDAALDDVAAIADHHGGAGFRRRLRAAAVCFAIWGAAGILSTTAPGIAENPPHRAMVSFIIFIVGVLLLLLSIAAPDDLP